jgi:hypothetical protein
MDLTVESYDMTVTSAYVTGGDTVITAGAPTDFMFAVVNDGDKVAGSLSATLTTSDLFVTINDDYATFGTLLPGSSGNCNYNPFNVSASANTPPGHRAEFNLEFLSSGGAVQSRIVSVSIGEKSQQDPQGPDEYGYYCFDDTDTEYAQCPVYSWVEIDPNYGGGGIQLSISDPSENADASALVNLPFTFQYYGQESNTIVVCSNGWISMNPDVSYTDFRNYPIPSCIGPDAMIAPFWDDLVTTYNGHVFSYHDVVNHRFIVEWSRMENYNSWGFEPEETFEVILFDPAYYPTSSGDGEILFQYYDITELSGPSDDNRYSTIGIENWEQRDGIQIVYWDTYDDPAAAHVQNGRAYLFTTEFTYLAGNPGMVVELTYQSGSPVPQMGGNVYFDVYVENVGSTALNFDAWLDVAYEGQTPTTVVLRSFTDYQVGWSINRPNTYFPVPAGYAAGDYTLTGRVGTHPDDVWDESGFYFEKTGPVTGEVFQPFQVDNMPDPFAVIDMGDMSAGLPSKYELFGVYPNPFNPAATIAYALPAGGKVTLNVYDISGRLVRNLVDGYRAGGRHEAIFDASGLASGVYIYRLEAGEFAANGKLILMK